MRKISIACLLVLALLLFCSVSYAEEPYQSQPPAITIEGPDDFKQTIQTMFDLIKLKDIRLYYWYAENANKIVLGDVDRENTAAMNNIDTTSQIVITIDTDFYNAVKAKYDKQGALVFVGFIGHECAHTQLRYNSIYTDEDVEGICNLAAARALQAVGAENTFHYKIWADGVTSSIKL